jgi:hypothetical protein
MTLIPLYGYIPNPNKPHEGDPLYVIRERRVSPTLYEYEGVIGHGYHEGEFKSDDWTSDRIICEEGFPIKFIKYDMRDLIFTYNTESNLVTIETHWRFESYEEEAKTLAKNVETDAIDKDEDETSYPYFRYPRTKDGIAISRVFATLFKDKNVKVFASKEHLG